MDTLIMPAAGWRPPTRSIPTGSPRSTAKKPEPRHWAEAAFQERWQDAVLGFLRERRRDAVPYWEVVNGVVGESCQATRWEVRFATRGILTAVKTLLHERRILRYRRRYLAILDLGGEIVPLETYRALCNRTATGRCAVDSTTSVEAVKSAGERL